MGDPAVPAGPSGLHPELSGREASASGSVKGNSRRSRPLGTLALVALIFYSVSGGPFGTEESLKLGTPLITICSFIVLPMVWSVPEALVTAELATAFPEACGFVAWVTAAYGPFWGFLEGFWKWTSGVTDNAIYPVLMLAYIETVFPALASGLPRVAFLGLTTTALTALNFRGLSVVGTTAITLATITLLPFVLMAVLSLPKVHVERWFRADVSGVDWPGLLNILFWNLNYFDSASTLAEEVQDPQRAFPRALAGAVALVVSSYLIPILVGVGIERDGSTFSKWDEGHYSVVAKRLGGPVLQWWVVVAAAVSNVGLFLAEMSADSFQLLGMAERGFLPAALARRSRYGTPTLAILLSSAGVIGITCLDFIDIVTLLNAMYCLAELLEFSAFVHLRWRHPELHRPYRVPLSTWGCTLMLAPACTLLVVVLGIPIAQGRWLVLGFLGGSTAFATALYFALAYARRRQLLQFLCDPPRGFDDIQKAPGGSFEASPAGKGVEMTDLTRHNDEEEESTPMADEERTGLLHSGLHMSDATLRVQTGHESA